MEDAETVVIGGGQAGLAASRLLAERGIEHVVLERGRIAERWRTQRWDSLMFQFPNWSVELPGMRLTTADPDGFSHKDEIVQFIERYAASCANCVRTGVNVTRLRRASTQDRFELVTSGGTIRARHVIVATGPYQIPRIPALRHELPPEVYQLHAADYRSPQDLPTGAVLVVGAGASGCQIADELLESGRTTYFAVGRHRRVPRRYRGRDVFWWRRQLGELDQSVDSTPPERRQPPPLVTGVHGGYDVDLRRSAERGLLLAGRLRAISEGKLAFIDDLEMSLRAGDRAYADFKSEVDAYIARQGLDMPPGSDDGAKSTKPLNSPSELDLRRAGITSILWATGYDFDFGWIDLPVFDARGSPEQYRGATRVDGLYFLGLQWLHKSKSSFLYGVGEDAGAIVEHIACSRQAG
jgi:putative flavoprotein involved in K+ transport